MKRTLSIIAFLLSGVLLFSACSDTTADDADTTTSADSSTTTAPQTNNDQPLSKALSIVYKPASGTESTATGDGSAALTVTNAFAKGDKITVTLAEGQHYLAFCLATDTVEESILYLPDSVFTFEVPNVSVSYPKDLTRRATITARIPTDEELATSRNLALNPADLIDATNVYPHASTTSVHDINNENNRLCFESRNIIDGFTQNNGHGGYPVQSWGPANTFPKTGSVTIDFGRTVTLSELIIYLRADFPHDTYWDSCTAVFSDGTEIDLSFAKTADAQSFKLNTPLTTTSVKFTNFNKVAGSEWAAWMEVEAIGADVIG